MRYAVLLASVLAPGTVPGAAAPVIDDFAFAAPITAAGEAGLYRLDLPLEVYQQTASNALIDIRVFNGRGEVVPYALRQEARKLTIPEDAQQLPVFPLRGDPASALNALRVTVGAGTVSVEAAGPDGGEAGEVSAFVIDARAITRPLAALTVVWPEETGDFAGRLAVEASDDLASWRAVRADAPVVNLRSGTARLVQRRIEFAPAAGKFWRIAWAGEPRPRVMFTAVLAEPAASITRAPPRTLTVAPASADAAAQEFTFDIGAAVPVERINLELPERNSVIRASVFLRFAPTDEWQRVDRARFYRLQVDDVEYVNPPLEIAAAPARHWRVKVDPAGGGLGAAAPRLAVSWFPHELVFAARGPAPFTLAFGSAVAAPAAVPPETLLPAAGSDAATAAITPAAASLGPIRVAGGAARLVAPPPPFPWKAALLWAVLVAGVLALGLMAWRLARELRAGPGSS